MLFRFNQISTPSWSTWSLGIFLDVFRKYPKNINVCLFEDDFGPNFRLFSRLTDWQAPFNSAMARILALYRSDFIVLLCFVGDYCIHCVFHLCFQTREMASSSSGTSSKSVDSWRASSANLCLSRDVSFSRGVRRNFQLAISNSVSVLGCLLESCDVTILYIMPTLLGWRHSMMSQPNLSEYSIGKCVWGPNGLELKLGICSKSVRNYQV